MVVLDATALLLLLRPDVSAPLDEGGKPVPRAKDRIDYLVQELEKAKTRILIPTPALSEVLVRMDPQSAHRTVEIMNRQSRFKIESFDTRAAVEVAAMSRDHGKPARKARSSEATYAKLKYDRQIIAIAAVAGAERIYSDDRDLGALAQRMKIPVTALAELPLPPEDAPNFDLFSELESSNE